MQSKKFRLQNFRGSILGWDSRWRPPGSVSDIINQVTNLEKLIYFSELDPLHKRNCRGLKLTNFILNSWKNYEEFDRITGRYWRHVFCFCARILNYNFFISRQWVTEEIFSKKTCTLHLWTRRKMLIRCPGMSHSGLREN